MTITGTAAGVPFLALPPASGDRDAPVVLAWHLMDPPRNKRSFAAALPLDGLDAWRIYLGLPLSGSRLPAGGWDEVMRLGYEDAPVHLQGPTSAQAVAEAGPALAAVRAQLQLSDAAPVGLLGGSMGAAVALEVLADGVLEAAATVLVSPLVQLRPTVEALAAFYGIDYAWSPASDAIAARMDYVARADAVAARSGPVRIITGADDRTAIREPAAALAVALRAKGVRVDERAIAGMAHALAEAPGDDPAPQTPHAARVDASAVEWFREVWPGRGRPQAANA